MLARYREVLREPHVARLLATALIGRMPQGMSTLAILLLLTPKFGYGKSGAVAGLAVATSGASNVLIARAVDRLGARVVLAPAATSYCVLAIVLALVGRRSYPTDLLICAALGVAAAPVSSVSRATWPRLLGDEAAQVLYGLEATAQELVFIAGPALVALVAGTVSARAALILSGSLGLVGVLGFVSAPAFAAAVPRRDRSTPRVPVLRTRVLSYAFVGAALTTGFSMTEIATVAFVSGRHATAASGVVLAIWSAGSLMGGLALGAGTSRVTDRALSVGVSLVGIGLALNAIAPGRVGLAAILFAGSTATAPALARLYTRMGSVAPRGATTEAFGWLSVGFQIGSSLGAAAGGVSVDGPGPRATFAIAGASALLGLLAIRWRPVASYGAVRQAADQDAA
ncbi:MAG TPA: MFS transporter [Mycobacteriales bacterium]|nr:MFS transporter [Mycobacteriales bacterium]